uniref:Uncharacterized protein n=1 Tax=Arundo donax TaxID=35708 RepID=A0A0A8YST7_ARUDO
MASLLGSYGGDHGRRRVHARSGGGGAWRSAAPPVRRLIRRLRSSLRTSAARSRRAPAVRFGYDLHSCSQNFDDGLGSSGHHSL